jgi:hypothetical protein
MSTKAEKIGAQGMAFDLKGKHAFHRHLIGPLELTMLFKDQEKLNAMLMEKSNNEHKAQKETQRCPAQ